jgi:hypothetical protein
MTSIRLHYSEGLIRRAVQAFWWRTTGWRYVGAFLVVLGSFSYLLWSGDRSWVVGLSGSGLVLAVAFAVALYAIHYRASVGRFRRMRKPEANIELGEERFRVSSDVGTSELAWSAVTEVWLFPEFLLLFLSAAHFITLPTADLDTNSRDFILAKARSNGAKVA